MTDLENNLSSVEVLRAQYRQTRYVSGLDAPLTSTGTLLLVRNRGLVWSQDVPFPVQFVLTDDLITEAFADQPLKIKTRDNNGQLFKFVGLFSSIFAGDKAVLGKTFNVDFVPINDDRWELSLMPHDAKIKRVFSNIIVRGSRLAEYVEIVEASGNRTVIHFSGMTTSPALLSIDEKRYFQN